MKYNGANSDTNHDFKDWLITVIISSLGLMLFVFDMVMLAFFIKAIKSIIKHYSKDYDINNKLIIAIIVIISITYITEMVWSDMFMWGSVVNFLGFFEDLRTLNS